MGEHMFTRTIPRAFFSHLCLLLNTGCHSTYAAKPALVGCVPPIAGHLSGSHLLLPQHSSLLRGFMRYYHNQVRCLANRHTCEVAVDTTRCGAGSGGFNE
jgi:hypothetical protein